MTTEGSVVQGSASCPVRHVDVAEQRDQCLSTAYRLVTSRYVERRLPVLVPSVNICAVLQQHRHCLLDNERESSMGQIVQTEGLFSNMPQWSDKAHVRVCRLFDCVWVVLKIFAIFKGGFHTDSKELCQSGHVAHD